MVKGTTPKHIFRVKIDTTLIKTVKITYSQDNKVVLSKRTEDCTLENGAIIARLAQEDTFLFDCNSLVTIQVRVLTFGGDALRSKSIVKSVDECFDDEVLV